MFINATNSVQEDKLTATENLTYLISNCQSVSPLVAGHTTPKGRRQEERSALDHYQVPGQKAES